MKSKPCVTSLVLAFLWHSVTAFLCDYADDVSVRKNAYMQISALVSISDLGFSMCERKCSNVTGSLSYNFFRSEGKCECLSENSTTSPHALVSREGWYHGDMNNVGKTSNVSCVCPDGQFCQTDFPALLRCPKTCPPPPSLANADVTLTPTSPVATAFYTCHENFGFFGTSSHVACTDKESWVGLNGSCKQVTWYNMGYQ